MFGIKFEPPAQSRNEAILEATLNGTAYTDPAQSRIEDLLLQLKAAIEAGGGGDVTALVTRVKAIEDQLYSTISGVPTNTDTGSMDLNSVDLDTVTTSGFYNAMTCSNAPSSYCTLIVIGYYLSGYCTQIAADVTTGKLYARTQINGTWGAWGEKVSAQDLAAVATSGTYSDLSGRPNLATVATSGAYSDLIGTPTIDTALSSTSTNAVQNKAVNSALATKANTSALTAETTARENADTALQTSIANVQPFLSGKKVYERYFGSSSGSDTYTVNKSDFGSGTISNCGIYLIYRIGWGTTPSISIYALAYSGNHAEYTTLQKIAGDDFDITVTQDVLSFATAGKVQIVAIT